MQKINLNGMVPEEVTGHTSKGDQPKWQVGEQWYKADHMGSEALSEVIVSRLLEHSNVTNFIAYSPVMIEYDGSEYRGCVSDNFRKKNEMLVPFEKLHRAYRGIGMAEALGKYSETADRISYAVEFVEKITGLQNVGAYLTGILELDAFFLNEDRHTNNLAVIRNEDTGEYRLCPVFDNGLGLLSDWNDYPVDRDIYRCMAKVRAKPFSSEFEEQMECAQELYGDQLRFRYRKADVTCLLNELNSFYDEKVLTRTEKILFEQMRRYPVFFDR